MTDFSQHAVNERREARRRAVRRRRLAAGALAMLLVAGAAVGIVIATGGDGSAPAATPPQRVDAQPVAETSATTDVAEPADTLDEEAALADATVSITAVGDIVMGTTTVRAASGQRTVVLRSGRPGAPRRRRPGQPRGDAVDRVELEVRPGSSDCFAFQTPPSYAKWLKGAGFDVMNLANNHAYDYGESGFDQTKRALRKAGLRITGPPGVVTVVEAGGVRVALVGFASYSWANDLTDVKSARRLIRGADDEADVVVVTFHGGAEGSDETHVDPGTEYFLGENRGDLARFAHAVVDAGADLVVGHGPHVLRGMEWYHDRLIAYSMGNFGGYEVFSLGGPLSVSGILKATLRGDGSWVKGELVPTQLVGSGIPALDPAERAHGLVRDVSSDDFGSRAMRVSVTGRLRPPNA